MSEIGQATRARILEQARQMFNERGIDNVGVRDLARELGMSPGNLSYWFTRKEDLVRALMDELRERNSRRGGGAAAPTVAGLLGGLGDALRAQLEYRCLTESIVHVARTWPELGARYRETEHLRRAELAARVRALAAAGALVGLDEPGDVARLVGTWSLVARFWLSERGISYPDTSDEAAVAHTLALLAHSLRPFVPDGAEVLAPWLAGVRPEAAGG